VQASPPAYESKIRAPRELERWSAQLPRPLVFINGVFVIMHRGHFDFHLHHTHLCAAYLLPLHSDASARRLGKPGERPINALEDRLAVVAALSMVDAVTWFEDDTPAQLIAACRPEVLAKGGDWPAERIVGAKDVLARGGRVVSIPFEHERSTTALLQRIRGARA